MSDINQIILEVSKEEFAKFDADHKEKISKGLIKAKDAIVDYKDNFIGNTGLIHKVPKAIKRGVRDITSDHPNLSTAAGVAGAVGAGIAGHKIIKTIRAKKLANKAIKEKK
jgi:hypothetical protein